MNEQNTSTGRRLPSGFLVDVKGPPIGLRAEQIKTAQVNQKPMEITRTRVDYTRGYVVDGKDNMFISYMKRLIVGSPTATYCLGILKDFVVGSGFGEIGKIQVNGQATLDDLLKAVAMHYTAYDRFYLRVKPMANTGAIDKIFIGNPENFRFSVGFRADGTPDPDIQAVVYNPDWKGTYRRYHQDLKMPLYDLMDKSENPFREGKKTYGKNYRGHIYSYQEPNLLNDLYSRPQLYNGEDVLLSDFRLWQFLQNFFGNGLFWGGVANVPGDPDAPHKTDQKGNVVQTKGQYYQELFAKLGKGSENTNRWLIHFYEEEEQKISLDPFKPHAPEDIFKSSYPYIMQTIFSLLKLPDIMVRATPGRLGGSEDIRIAIKLYNQRTDIFRTTITRVLKNMLLRLNDKQGFTDADIEEMRIQKFEDVADLPQHVLEKLDPEKQIETIEREYNLPE